MIDFFQSRKSVDLGAVPCYSSPGENKYVSKQRNTSDLNFKTPTLKSSVNESHKKNLDGLNTATKAGKARNAQTSSHFKNGYSETSQKFSRAIFKNSGSQISSISNFEDLLHHSINEEQSPQQNSKYFENEKESVYDPLSYDYSDESFTFYNHPELYDFSRLKIEPIKETPKKSKPKIESIDITKPHHVTEWSTGGSSRLCSTDSSINLSPFTSSKAKPKTGHRRIVSDIHASIAEDLANDILNKSSNDLNNSMNSGFLTKILENDLENFELIAKEKIFNEM